MNSTNIYASLLNYLLPSIHGMEIHELLFMVGFAEELGTVLVSHFYPNLQQSGPDFFLNGGKLQATPS